MNKKITVKRVVIAIIFCVVAVSLIRQNSTMNKIQQQITEKQKQINQLKESNQQLQDEVNETKTDAFIERKARERLKMIKPGEEVIVQENSNANDKKN
ncbi:cell division protein FtsL [Inconstantimicrobium mannanitabidum]|uniref:Uncharacterized protein n=1 Tax=Inconstantimicrobium mannanitabidum TaxID=1604901 RepID=A0ACB5RI09_9CLOT|nr:cell division protein FtsL [Clostridium sp. TW13]GKX68732.1 hypothetical protein rsdtw13_39900 [Clostridium sp. TW13]